MTCLSGALCNGKFIGTIIIASDLPNLFSTICWLVVGNDELTKHERKDSIYERVPSADTRQFN